MKTGVIATGTLTNKERLLVAYAAYNRQGQRCPTRSRERGCGLSRWQRLAARQSRAGLIARMDIQNVEAAPR